ncbi:MAG TPA: hypothetical protein VLG92_05230 [Candidatus Saccharimonadia bacterium]|nr:hypothetical protein [Candidatus Saccharimonadia bacterium]
MTGENITPSPEQSASSLVAAPQFIIFPHIPEAIQVTLADTYWVMCANPQEFQRTLGIFAEKPYDRPTGFDWSPLIERGPDSYQLYVTFEFDEATLDAISADAAHRPIKGTRNDHPDDIMRKKRIRAFEIFLTRLAEAQSLGGTSLAGAA